MASVIGIQSPQNPNLTISQIANGLAQLRAQNQHSMLMGEQAKNMQQAALLSRQMQPYQLKQIQAQTQLMQQKAADQQALDQAMMAHQAMGSGYTLGFDPIRGNPYVLDKNTGKFVNAASEPAAGQVNSTNVGQSSPTQSAIGGGGGFSIAPGQSSAPEAAQTQYMADTPQSVQNDGANAKYSVSPFNTRYALGGMFTDPNTGEQTPIFSPTTQANTLALGREMGIGGVTGLSKHIIQSISPYQGGLGRGQISLQGDINTYEQTTDPVKKAQLAQKLTDYYSIANAKTELGGTLARAASGAAPAEKLQLNAAEQALRSLPDIPGNFPKNLYGQGDKKYYDFMGNLGKSEVHALAIATNPIAAEQASNKKAQTDRVKVIDENGRTGTMSLAALQAAIKDGRKFKRIADE